MSQSISLPIRALLLDDEPDACKNMEIILSKYWKGVIEIVGIAYDTRQAELMIIETHPDVVFIDIEMPGENAFQFLDRIGYRDFEIIFVTAYDEYALRALKLNAVDYILKPISIDELKMAISKLHDRLLMRKMIVGTDKENSFQVLFSQINKKEIPQNIVLRSRDTVSILPFQSVYYIEAQGSYSCFYFESEQTGKNMLMSYPLSYYEEILPTELFFRTHKSYLVNTKHVQTVHKSDQYAIELKNGIQLPLSRRRYQGLMEFLKGSNI